MMVFLRFLVLVIWFHFTLLLVMGDSITLNQQALAYGNGVAAPDGSVVSFHHKELVDGVPAAAAAAVDVRKHRLGGRKMVVENAVTSEEAKKIEEADPKISGATSVGKCENEGKREYKLSGRSLLPVKLNNGDGFIAFNADYHVPKPHPPKNN